VPNQQGRPGATESRPAFPKAIEPQPEAVNTWTFRPPHHSSAFPPLRQALAILIASRSFFA
jgi:hypothetical protein